MSSQQKKLLFFSGLLMLLALVVQRIQLSHRAAIVVGLAEVLLAIATGIGFGITVSKNEK